MSNVKKEIIVEDVLELLAQGKTRKEIGESYELNASEVKELFKHEDLKGRRSHKVPTFVVVKRESLPQTPHSGAVIIEQEEEEEVVVEEERNTESSY